MRKNKTPVVVVRKDKRLNKTGHLLAFMLTGGTSSVYTAAKAASNAGYNARTRQLQAEADATPDPVTEGKIAAAVQGVAFDPAANFRAEHVPSSAEYKARHRTRGRGGNPKEAQ